MNKSKIKLIISIALVIFTIITSGKSSYAKMDIPEMDIGGGAAAGAVAGAATAGAAATGAAASFNPDDWDPKPSLNGSGEFISRSGKILGWIQYIGIIVAVVALTIIGLKYMFGSIEQKAEYKKTMLPYIIGCFMVVGVSLVIGMVGGLNRETSATRTFDFKGGSGTVYYKIKCSHCGKTCMESETTGSREGTKCPHCGFTFSYIENQ